MSEPKYDFATEFGREILPDWDAFCFQNALKAFLLVKEKYPQSELSIYSVDTPKGTHAYLLLNGRVYNQGVTWITDYYPNFSEEQLKQIGKDVTTELLLKVSGLVEDQHNYRRYIEKKLGKNFLVLASKILDTCYPAQVVTAKIRGVFV